MAGQSDFYRALVRLYPKDFRRHYGDDLVQNFVDLLGRDGASRTWPRVALDLIITVPRYRLETVMNPRKSTAALYAAFAALAGRASYLLVAPRRRHTARRLVILAPSLRGARDVNALPHPTYAGTCSSPRHPAVVLCRPTTAFMSNCAATNIGPGNSRRKRPCSSLPELGAIAVPQSQVLRVRRTHAVLPAR